MCLHYPLQGWPLIRRQRWDTILMLLIRLSMLSTPGMDIYTPTYQLFTGGAGMVGIILGTGVKI
ncbi:hypothetical protein Aam_066_025 [Acidocella aminolytica 101 = DSM 11237]|uniref:Uncharacterized protein n=1 Tax=Acidocella aminolytica 101 = DSM 11237 TaxID=1120923 RepID=A0A0D6PHV2_9PROT|nr:hypothetical protein Aam_066_025 [Acidocella aminolytica 101 = DSM 11237]GBQ43354.1 hypothetical protein AA11237_3261 [Acidocella aminolytica 101 = DSM 11237]